MNVTKVAEWGLSTILYVSRSTLPIEGDSEAVNEIVNVAVARNERLRVTGALLYTHLHFAQVLEGPLGAIRELMSSILRDDRHTDVTVILQNGISARKFKSWAMAYAGPLPLLDRRIKPLLHPGTVGKKRIEGGEELIADMVRLRAPMRP